MQARTCMLSAITLGTAMLFGVAAMAADLPKEGTFTVTASTYGTAKGDAVGKGRWIGEFDDSGPLVGSGLLDHTTTHCFGLLDSTNGMIGFRGYCVFTDPDGDRIAMNIASDGTHPFSAKTWSGSGTFTTGTGKYTGVSGNDAFHCRGGEFKTPAEGTFVDYCVHQGSYKLP